MAEIANGIVENKNLRVFAVWCKWLGWALHVADACGTFFQWYCNGAHGWVCNGSFGDNAPRSTVAGGVLFSVWWDNRVGINRRRADGILQLACNGDMATSIKVCGERPDWPVSDHFGRHTRNIHVQERQERLHGEREWWVHGEGGCREGGERFWALCA